MSAVATTTWFVHRERVRFLIDDYHSRTGCRGTLRGRIFPCDCETEIMKMMVFKELTDKWLS